MLTPPSGPRRKNFNVQPPKKFRLKRLFQKVPGMIMTVFAKMLSIPPEAISLARKAGELGNPTETDWPSETIPMNSRLLIGGFWNYSFFQFNRNFAFPFWAHEQYNPRSVAFIPRSHNLLSINQTHRNWIAISWPGKTEEISVDMAGSIMPFYDGYTIEFAILENQQLIRPHDIPQSVRITVPEPGKMEISFHGRLLTLEAAENGLIIKGSGKNNLVMAVRPFNMEGAASLEKLDFMPDRNLLTGDAHIEMKILPPVHQLSGQLWGDSLLEIPRLVRLKKSYFSSKGESRLYRTRKKRKSRIRNFVRDSAGLASASFVYDEASHLQWFVHDRRKDKNLKIIRRDAGEHATQRQLWETWFPEQMDIQVPGEYSDWFKNSRNHLMTLWDYDTIKPGSYTYHHFWIRDAAVMMHALLFMGAKPAVTEIIKTFPGMVKRNGLFKSQAGEWDSNGQALWILARFAKITGDTEILGTMRKKIIRMLNWIKNTLKKNYGVLPPGFSAEHLGVADWYLWDNFWSLGGIAEMRDFNEYVPYDYDTLYSLLHKGLQKHLRDYNYYPGALGREKDAGMIGSIVANYPLQLKEYNDERMKTTVDLIHDEHFFKGGFFQENIHSGVNPYLTLQVAGCYLMNGENHKAWKITDDILKWAQKCYTFPEAVHMHTRGGCMGDGFHGWAFAESVILMRNFFLLEKQKGPVFLAGIKPEWYKEKFSAVNMHSVYGKTDVLYKHNELSISNSKRFDTPLYLVCPKHYKFKIISGGSIEKAEPDACGMPYSRDRIYKVTTTSNKIKLLVIEK